MNEMSTQERDEFIDQLTDLLTTHKRSDEKSLMKSKLNQFLQVYESEVHKKKPERMNDIINYQKFLKEKQYEIKEEEEEGGELESPLFNPNNLNQIHRSQSLLLEQMEQMIQKGSLPKQIDSQFVNTLKKIKQLNSIVFKNQSNKFFTKEIEGPFSIFHFSASKKVERAVSTMDTLVRPDKKKMSEIIQSFAEQKMGLQEKDFSDSVLMVEKLWEYIIKLKSKLIPKQIRTSQNINFIISDNKFLNVQKE